MKMMTDENKQGNEKTGFVDLRSLQEYIWKEVTKLTNNMQVPTAYFPSGLSNFPISKSLQ